MSNYTGFDPRDLGLTVKHSAGLNEVLCVCPWHGGSDSLCVNLQTGKFICYSCGQRGDVAKLVKQTGGQIAWTSFERPSAKDQEREWRHLLDGDPAYDDPYLIHRGVTNEQVDKFNIRRCWNGVAFPLVDRLGATRGALVRRREGAVRYVTLGEKPAVWPLDSLSDVPPGHGLAVTEGVFGVLSADRAKIPAVAVLGAAVKAECQKWLNPFHLAITFDDDLAGFLGAFKLMTLCESSQALLRPVEADKLNYAGWMEIFDDSYAQHWTKRRTDLMTACYARHSVTEEDFAAHLGPKWFAPGVWDKYYRAQRRRTKR